MNFPLLLLYIYIWHIYIYYQIIRKWLVPNNGVFYYHFVRFTLFEYCNISITTFITTVVYYCVNHVLSSSHFNNRSI